MAHQKNLIGSSERTNEEKIEALEIRISVLEKLTPAIDEAQLYLLLMRPRVHYFMKRGMGASIGKYLIKRKSKWLKEGR